MVASLEERQVYGEMMAGARQKVLITGVGGMLGTDLAEILKNDFEIIGLDKKPAPHLGRPIEICDLLQERKLRDVMLAHQPSVLIHCAALTDVDYCEEHPEEAEAQNVGATRNLVVLANELDIPIIFFSTDYVFGGTREGEYLEDDTGKPLSVYGRTKWEAEEVIRSTAKRAALCRISWLYGVYGRSFPRAILGQTESVKNIRVVSDQTGRPTYTKDVAGAILRMLSKKKEMVFDSGVRMYHISNSGQVTWAGFARFILEKLGRSDVTVEEISSRELNRPAPRPYNSVLSLKKTESALGIQFRPWEDAVADFLVELADTKKKEAAKAQEKAEGDPQ